MTSSLGGYVLGVIEDGERALIDSHVAQCAECQGELETLMRLSPFLACITAEETAGLEAAAPRPEGLLTRLRSAITAKHRQRRARRASPGR